MEAVCKFDQLRLKTNTELIQLITHELDLGLKVVCRGYPLASLPPAILRIMRG